MNTPASHRKLRPQPALAHLTDAEREQIADWVHTQTYQQVLERVAKPREEGGFDLRVSVSVLQRLRDRTAHHHLINGQLEDKLQLTELLALENGEQVPWSKGTHQLVQRAAFKVALLPDQTPPAFTPSCASPITRAALKWTSTANTSPTNASHSKNAAFKSPKTKPPNQKTNRSHRNLPASSPVPNAPGATSASAHAYTGAFPKKIGPAAWPSATDTTKTVTSKNRRNPILLPCLCRKLCRKLRRKLRRSLPN